VFKDCRIPRGNLLGGKEEIPKESSGGFAGVMKTFNMTRPAVAAIGLGISQAALDFTREQLQAAGVVFDYAGDGHWSGEEDVYNPKKAATVIQAWIAAGGKLAAREAVKMKHL